VTIDDEKFILKLKKPKRERKKDKIKKCVIEYNVPEIY